MLGVGLAQEMGRLAGAVQGGFAFVATGRVVRVTVNRVSFWGWIRLSGRVEQAALPGWASARRPRVWQVSRQGASYSPKPMRITPARTCSSGPNSLRVSFVPLLSIPKSTGRFAVAYRLADLDLSRIFSKYRQTTATAYGTKRSGCRNVGRRGGAASASRSLSSGLGIWLYLYSGCVREL